jgi:hypothetical protein
MREGVRFLFDTELPGWRLGTLHWLDKLGSLARRLRPP